MQGDLYDNMLSDFLDESTRLIECLSDDLRSLEEWVDSLADDHQQPCNTSMLNRPFRSAHALKGLSALLGLRDFNALANRLETVFNTARQGRLIVRADTVDLLRTAVDRLKSLCDALRDDRGDEVDTDEVGEQLLELLEHQGRVPSEQPAEAAPTPLDAPAETREPSIAPLDDATSELVKRAEEWRFIDVEDKESGPEEYIDVFIDETDVTLDTLMELMTDESSPRDEAFRDKVLCEWHRIKGGAAAIGLHRVAKVAHLIEEILLEAAEHRIPIHGDLLEAILACADGVRDYIERFRRGDRHEEDRFEPLARDLTLVFRRRQRETAARHPDDGASDEPCPAEEPPEPSVAIDDESRPDFAEACAAIVQEKDLNAEQVLIGRIALRSDVPLPHVKLLVIHEKLAQLGRLLLERPEIDESVDVPYREYEFALLTDVATEDVRQRIWIAGVDEVVIEPLIDSQEETTDASQETTDGLATNAYKGKFTRTLRVDIARLDQLMNLAGQFAIGKAQLARIVGEIGAVGDARHVAQSIGAVQDLVRAIDETMNRNTRGGAPCCPEMTHYVKSLQKSVGELSRAFSDTQLRHSSIVDLGEAAHQLDRIAEGIQLGVMNTRMVQIGPLFHRMKRVVQEVARTNAKQIRLDIQGEHTKLDKRMIDELGDPLIHLLRNSADHGIESPTTREQNGKPREGVIKLSASHHGNHVFIEVSDDGRGLDPDRIRRKAIERGLMSPAEATRLSADQVCQMIWQSGLSTAERITEVSGRGFGMDIVKQTVENLSGTIDLTSIRGRGARTTIKLPLTMAIRACLMVEIAGDVLALPIETVREVARIRIEELPSETSVRTVIIREREVPVVEMDNVLHWRRPMRAASRAGQSHVFVVLLRDRGREFGLTVDRVIGEQDVVVKSLAENFRNVRGVSGACILGDGGVGLILDVGLLLETCSRGLIARTDFRMDAEALGFVDSTKLEKVVNGERIT